MIHKNHLKVQTGHINSDGLSILIRLDLVGRQTMSLYSSLLLDKNGRPLFVTMLITSLSISVIRLSLFQNTMSMQRLVSTILLVLRCTRVFLMSLILLSAISIMMVVVTSMSTMTRELYEHVYLVMVINMLIWGICFRFRRQKMV